MKMLITGANSFIGLKLIGLATVNGWDVTAIVRPNCKRIGILSSCNNVSIVQLDFEEYEEIEFYAQNVDVAVLLAWNGTRGTHRMDSQMQQDNYTYSINAIKGLLNGGCKRIITAGSQAEYGIIDGIITEEIICNPNTEYGFYKLRLYTDSMDICSRYNAKLIEPRYFSLYGPGDYEDTLIMYLIRRMCANLECQLTEGSQLWDYLYIDDAIDVLFKMCYMPCMSGAYNIGSGNTRPLRDFVEEIYKITNSRSKLCFGAVPYPNTGAVSIVPDITKARKMFAWEPEINFEQGIRKIIKAEGINEKNKCIDSNI